MFDWSRFVGNVYSISVKLNRTSYFSDGKITQLKIHNNSFNVLDIKKIILNTNNSKIKIQLNSLTTTFSKSTISMFYVE